MSGKMGFGLPAGSKKAGTDIDMMLGTFLGYCFEVERFERISTNRSSVNTGNLISYKKKL